MGQAKPAILIVDHGSRRDEANRQLDALAERVRAREPGRVVHVAHLEIAAPSIAEGIDACVRDGAREIVVHPYMLSPGRHSREDIPAECREAGERYPDVRIRVSAPLGLHDKLVDVLLERIEEA